MNKKHGLCCIILGTAMLIAALSLVFYNSQENKRSGEAADKVLSELKENIPEPSTEIYTETASEDGIYSEYDTEPQTCVQDTTMMIDEHGYIGIIAIPDLGLELPVMSDWSYPDLKISPCRYKGSVFSRDIVIAAHNYRSHFGRLSELSGGENIVFTAADGKVYNFEVSQITELDGRDIEGMDFGSSDSWDLTLFTCTLGGRSRVTVRAVAADRKSGE